jgi:putative transcriptional regulator
MESMLDIATSMLYITGMGERLVSHLRVHRSKAVLTQDALAKAVGVSRQTINSIEAERYVPSTVLALRLSQALGTTVEKLFALPPPSAGGSP